MFLQEALDVLAADLAAVKSEDRGRRGSRFIGADAEDEGFVKHVAGGGSYAIAERERRSLGHSPRGGLSGLMAKALAEGTPSSGGYLVPQEISNEIVTMIRARSALMAMGPRVVPVKKELAVTSLSTGATAGYVAENAPLPVSEET